jgi:hypothetical protein
MVSVAEPSIVSKLNIEKLKKEVQKVQFPLPDGVFCFNKFLSDLSLPSSPAFGARDVEASKV